MNNITRPTKLVLALSALLLSSVSVNAQYQMIVRTNDGKTSTFETSEIDSIYFSQYDLSSEHEYVDLGLSVKWATCNVGATKPYEYGDYFAWGATEPYYEPGYAQSDSPVWKSGKSTGYTWTNAPYQTISNAKDSTTRWTKYLGSTTSIYKATSATDADAIKIVLDPEDDAATANWGGTWRMPTNAELQELRNSDNCTWIWCSSGNSEYNGIPGYKVTSKKSGFTDRSIFLPASGFRGYTYLDYLGSSGLYWSGSLYTDGPCDACGLGFFSGIYGWYYGCRGNGFAVRPVCQ